MRFGEGKMALEGTMLHRAHPDQLRLRTSHRLRHLIVVRTRLARRTARSPQDDARPIQQARASGTSKITPLSTIREDQDEQLPPQAATHSAPNRTALGLARWNADVGRHRFATVDGDAAVRGDGHLVVL